MRCLAEPQLSEANGSHFSSPRSEGALAPVKHNGGKFVPQPT